MAKNRAAATGTPVGKGEAVVTAIEFSGGDVVPVKEKDTARIDRALMHLEFLEEELIGLAGDKSSLAAAMRQTAAQMKNQLNTQISKWPPIKTIRELLQKVRALLPEE